MKVCKWCGEKITGNGEKHFAEKEKLTCNECKWYYTDFDEDGNEKGKFCRFAEIAEVRNFPFQCVKYAHRKRTLGC